MQGPTLLLGILGFVEVTSDHASFRDELDPVQPLALPLQPGAGHSRRSFLWASKRDTVKQQCFSNLLAQDSSLQRNHIFCNYVAVAASCMYWML